MTEQGVQRPSPPPGSASGTDRPLAEPRLVLRVLGSSRFFAIFAVLGSFLSAVTLVVYGALVAWTATWDTLARGDVSVEGAKHLTVELVQLTDAFLLGTVLFIVASGLYQLFINPDLPVPHWLQIDDLDQLKEKLIGVVAVLLAVTFLAFVVELGDEASVLEFGAAVSLVIVALSVLMYVTGRHRHGDDGPARGA